MTVYADETFYNEHYLHGRKAVISAAFDYYAMQASSLIDRYTFGNVDAANTPDAVRYCCCELAEALFEAEQTRTAAKSANGASVASESVQGWSASYEPQESRTKALEASQSECIRRWLGNTGLLYAGRC